MKRNGETSFAEELDRLPLRYKIALVVTGLVVSVVMEIYLRVRRVTGVKVD